MEWCKSRHQDPLSRAFRAETKVKIVAGNNISFPGSTDFNKSMLRLSLKVLPDFWNVENLAHLLAL